MAKVSFTAGKVAAFKCPPDKQQAFMWDSTVHGLGLRATPKGKPTYVFQGEYLGKTVRIAIGKPSIWSIDKAQKKARELQGLIDQGIDPRDLKRDAIAKTRQREAEAKQQADEERKAQLTFGDVWCKYLQDRKQHWGDISYTSHVKHAKQGGVKTNIGTRGTGVTMDGPLYEFLSMPLRDVKAYTIEAWAAKHAKERKTTGRLCLRMLKTFFNWCLEDERFKALLPDGNPAGTKKSREAFGPAGVKNDNLLKTQLESWFSAIQTLTNPLHSAYLQMVLLTGSRSIEMLKLKWKDVDFKWKSLTIRDKDAGERIIPLTPYVERLLEALPRSGPYVFAGAEVLKLKPGDPAPKVPKHMTTPHKALDRVCQIAGIEGLTVHGLRRSFKSLTEWLEVPVGVVAQIQGHKPSATAEKHYTVRPLDLLAIHHNRIEAWILEQAKVELAAEANTGKLRAVN
ncbi:tyrosine-type recombinase/integrase [Rhodoferax mekongensis]|uniref:tyrosine-type recombinase/integrase n=1 Tax=Rhodoferax mekongensis TaxID=3068341 RepID=UPI0028BE3776|nr:integrase family protein [Rhodoferax sp. TBRC 17199]MDT7514561.1 integrase family protein [Rhodoferax sp. TBRC 17199]